MTSDIIVGGRGRHRAHFPGQGLGCTDLVLTYIAPSLTNKLSLDHCSAFISHLLEMIRERGIGVTGCGGLQYLSGRGQGVLVKSLGHD
jgi:hypothetical protein